MKHAFLIIAHADYEVLRVLVDMLDNKCCDIYIMIDKKHRFLPNCMSSMLDYLC